MTPEDDGAAVAAFASTASSGLLRIINKTNLNTNFVVSDSIRGLFSTISREGFDWDPFPDEVTLNQPWGGSDVRLPAQSLLELTIADSTEGDCNGVKGAFTLADPLDETSGTYLTSDVEFVWVEGQCILKFTGYDTQPAPLWTGQSTLRSKAFLNQILDLEEVASYGSATGLNDPVAVLSLCWRRTFDSNGCQGVPREKNDFVLNAPTRGVIQFFANTSMPGGKVTFSQETASLYLKDSYSFAANQSADIGLGPSNNDEQKLNETITFTFEDDVGEVVAHVDYVSDSYGYGVQVNGLEVISDKLSNDPTMTIVFTRVMRSRDLNENLLPLSDRDYPVSQISICDVNWYKENNGCIAGQNQHENIVGGFNMPLPLLHSETDEPSSGVIITSGAWAGIAVAGLVWIVSLTAFIIHRRKRASKASEDEIGTDPIPTSIDDMALDDQQSTRI
eukprot:Clim_evm62s199 gene=Clim_evmTU62s199